MKKRTKIIIITTLILIAIFFIFGLIIYSNDNLKFKYEYELYNYVEYSNGKTIKVNIPSNNNVDILNEEELIDKFSNGTGIIYLGYPSCPWCRNVIGVLLDFSNDYNEILYYTDIHSVSSKKEELFNILEEYLEIDEDGNKKMYVPDVFFVKDGEIIGHHLSTVESYTNPFLGMNKDEKEELYNIYLEIYNKMSE